MKTLRTVLALLVSTFCFLTANQSFAQALILNRPIQGPPVRGAIVVQGGDDWLDLSSQFGPQDYYLEYIDVNVENQDLRSFTGAVLIKGGVGFMVFEYGTLFNPAGQMNVRMNFGGFVSGGGPFSGETEILFSGNDINLVPNAKGFKAAAFVHNWMNTTSTWLVNGGPIPVGPGSPGFDPRRTTEKDVVVARQEFVAATDQRFPGYTLLVPALGPVSGYDPRRGPSLLDEDDLPE